MNEILKYDLIIENYLFDGDSTRKPQEHILVKELGKVINHDAQQFRKYSAEQTTLLVFFMSVIRGVPLKICQKSLMPLNCVGML